MKHYISSTITVSDISVEVVRKNIRSLRLAVYPPEGRVRLSVPRHTTDEYIRLMVASRLPWIKKKQAHIEQLPRQTELEYVSGECHCYQGKHYLLNVVERCGKHELVVDDHKAEMILYVRPNTIKEKRALVVERWYRQQLEKAIPALIEKWQPIIKKQLADWGVKKMKTKWGSCNITDKRIWLGLELAKKPAICLEYVFVHEMVHLHERYHNANFRRLMDKYLPDWRLMDDILRRPQLEHGPSGA